jgi:hypothetical protein
MILIKIILYIEEYEYVSVWWHVSMILAMQEAIGRRIMVWGRPRQNHETLPKK